MVVMMPNIPRRKIYETLLIFEDGMIEMNIVLFNKENFAKYLDAFNDDGYKKIRSSYKEIKALLVMFLENKKFATNEEFEEELKKLVLDIKKTNRILMNNPNLSFGFKMTIKKMNFELNKFKSVNNIFIGKFLYKSFDRFNSYIPKILEIRRDHMKK